MRCGGVHSVPVSEKRAHQVAKRMPQRMLSSMIDTQPAGVAWRGGGAKRTMVGVESFRCSVLSRGLDVTSRSDFVVAIGWSTGAPSEAKRVRERSIERRRPVQSVDSGAPTVHSRVSGLLASLQPRRSSPPSPALPRRSSRLVHIRRSLRCLIALSPSPLLSSSPHLTSSPHLSSSPHRCPLVVRAWRRPAPRAAPRRAARRWPRRQQISRKRNKSTTSSQ